MKYFFYSTFAVSVASLAMSIEGFAPAILPTSSVSQRPAANAVAFLRRGNDDHADTPPSWSWKMFSNPFDSDGDPPATDGRDRDNEEDPKTEKQQQPKKKKGYQRAEDWDAEQKEGQNTWEQKAQFDGLQGGNRLRQNDILNHHLGGF